MSNRVYRTEKVDDIMGLKDQKVYDKIDVFVDRKNQNNQWAILHTTEFKKGKPYDKQEIIRFLNNNEMMIFLKNNFDCYELNHLVNPLQKHIFFHYIDYCNVNYMLHDGKPHLNYIELNYFEYENGTFYRKKMNLPKEYEKMFDEIIRTSKRIPMNTKDIGNLHITTDVYDERKQARHAMISKYTIPMEEYLTKTGSKIKNVKLKGNRKIVRNLKIVAASTLIATIMASGYHLVTHNLDNSDYLEQHNAIRNAKDINIYFNKGDNGIIIDKLMEEKYDEVSIDELNKLFAFLSKIDLSNYDNNSSFNSFDYDDYFYYKLIDSNNYYEILPLLKKIEKLYKNSFVLDNKVTINKEKAKEYIDYVASLTFMYDSYHDVRLSNSVPINNQGLPKKTASTAEISLYDSLPPVLKMIIMTQLRGVMTHTDYKVTNNPLYYFKSTNKSDLINEIDNILIKIQEELYRNCGYTYISKGK